MSEDVSNKVENIVNIETDEDGPEEGEIQDDSSDEEGVCHIENEAFKPKSAYYGNTLEVAATECSRTNPENGVVLSGDVRIGYPACVQEVYRGVPWTEKVEKYETFGSSRSHPRTGVKGADYQLEKENRSKHFKCVRNSGRVRSSASISPEQDSGKKQDASRSVRTPSNSRRKLPRTTVKTHIHTARENHRKRRRSAEERRRYSSVSDRTKLITKKNSASKIPSDLEAQIQKTKKRFQNKDAIINKTHLPAESSIKNIETVNLSSSECQDLNKSSSSIEILEVSPSNKNSQTKDSEETIVTIDIKSPVSCENIKASNDENKEELNLRLIALKSAIQAKYGKGKNVKGKQKSKEAQTSKVEEESEAADVEPVDMDLSVTDDEKEGSDIPVIINTNSVNEALMFASHLDTQNWNHMTPEIPVHSEESDRYIVMDETASSPTSHYFIEPVQDTSNAVNSAITYSDESAAICNQNLDTLSVYNVYQPRQDMEVSPAQATSLPEENSNIAELIMQNSRGVEDEDEELLRAQLLIAISNKQNPVPQTDAVEPVNKPIMLPPSKPSTISVQKQPDTTFKGSKLGSKLILKEIYKNKKTQKLSRNYKRQLKEVKRKAATPRALSGNTHLTTVAASSKNVRATSQTAGSVARIVICLGEDTETEDECEPTKVPEPKTESSKIANVTAQSQQSQLVQNVDQFLKQVRQNVEQQQQPKSKPTSVKQSHTEHATGSTSASETASLDALISDTCKEKTVETEQQLSSNITTSDDLTNQIVKISVLKKTSVLKNNKSGIDVKMTKDQKVPDSIDKIPKQSKKMTNKSSLLAANKELRTTKKLIPKTPVSSKTTIVTKGGTPSALSHLPSSQQVEYRRLKLEIARREELRKLKMRLGQPVAKNLKDREISLVEQTKLEITVSNAKGGEEAESTRTVRQAVSEDDSSQVSITENIEILKNSCTDNVLEESNKNEECSAACNKLEKSEETAEEHEILNNKKVDNIESGAEQPDVVLKHAEDNAQTPENKKSLSSKRKSIEPEIRTKRVKCNNDVTKVLYDSEIIQHPEIKINVEELQNSCKHKNTSTKQSNDMQELPGLSISLSHNGRNVEEIKVNTKKDTKIVEETLISNDASETCKSSEDQFSACDSQVNESRSSSNSPILKKNMKINQTSPLTTKLYKQQAKVNKKNNVVKKEKLRSAEKQLLGNRQELLQQLMNLESLLEQVEHKQAQMADAEARVEALRRELVRAEIRAEEERSAVKKLFSQVGLVRVEVAQARTQCAGLSKTCQRLGHDAEGLAYHVPLDGADELKTHLQHVVELTQKTRKTKQIPHTTSISNSIPAPPVSVVETSCDKLPQHKDLNTDLVDISNQGSNLSNIVFSTSNSLKCEEKTHALVDNNEQPKTSNCIIDLEEQKFCVDKEADTALLSHLPLVEISDKTIPFQSNNDLNYDLDSYQASEMTETPTNKHKKSATLLPEKLPTTSLNAYSGLPLSLKPYKSPLEHMKPRGGIQQQKDDLLVSMDPNKVMCPYALTGRCLDDECNFLHPYTNKL